eukprot:UN28615
MAKRKNNESSGEVVKRQKVDTLEQAKSVIADLKKTIKDLTKENKDLKSKLQKHAPKLKAPKTYFKDFAKRLVKQANKNPTKLQTVTALT